MWADLAADVEIIFARLALVPDLRTMWQFMHISDVGRLQGRDPLNRKASNRAWTERNREYERARHRAYREKRKCQKQ